MSELRRAFELVLANRSLDAELAECAFGEILDGGESAPETLVAAFLIALKLKGESSDELAGGARAMRARARKLELDSGNVLDTAGTGGDGAGTFNISTGAALIAAAAGVPVAKHGNRAISGRVGAADLMESLGVVIDRDPPGLARCLREANFCFVFAPAYHPALARLAGLRRTLGTRTAFNLIAPLANPAQPKRQLLGVGDPRMFRAIAEASASLGIEHAMVVHSEDGLDEISCGAPTRIAEIRRGDGIREYQITPENFGIERSSSAVLAVTDPKDAVSRFTRALGGEPGAERDVLVLNAGAAIYVGGKTRSLAEGVDTARVTLASGAPLKTLERLRIASRADRR